MFQRPHMEWSHYGLRQLVEPIERTAAAIGLRGAIRLVQEFTDGKTQSRVVLVEQRSASGVTQSHYVFKVGNGALLMREVDNYLQLFLGLTRESCFVPMAEPEKTKAVLRKDEVGAIAYHHVAASVGNPADSVSLSRFFKDCLEGKREVDQCIDVLNRVVGAIATLYRETESAFGMDLYAYYLDRWFPDYSVCVDSWSEQNGRLLLTHQRLGASYFYQRVGENSSPEQIRENAEKPNRCAELSIADLSLEREARNQKISLSKRSHYLFLDVDISALSSNVEEALQRASRIDVWSEQVQSRHERYRKHLTAAFPSTDLDVDTFYLDRVGARVPNPLKRLSETLGRFPPSQRVRVSRAHGDLHPGNVLLVGHTPVIIDYGLARKALPLGVDLIRLLGGLIRDIVSEVLSFDELQLVLWQVFVGGSGSSQLQETARRARHVLSHLWSRLKDLLGGDAVTLPNQLFGYAWLGLKWPISNPSNFGAYRACFLLAAVAARLIYGEPVTTGPVLQAGRMPEPTRKQAVTTLEVDADALLREGRSVIRVASTENASDSAALSAVIESEIASRESERTADKRGSSSLRDITVEISNNHPTVSLLSLTEESVVQAEIFHLASSEWCEWQPIADLPLRIQIGPGRKLRLPRGWYFRDKAQEYTLVPGKQFIEIRCRIPRQTISLVVDTGMIFPESNSVVFLGALSEFSVMAPVAHAVFAVYLVNQSRTIIVHIVSDK